MCCCHWYGSPCFYFIYYFLRSELLHTASHTRFAISLLYILLPFISSLSFSFSPTQNRFFNYYFLLTIERTNHAAEGKYKTMGFALLLSAVCLLILHAHTRPAVALIFFKHKPCAVVVHDADGWKRPGDDGERWCGRRCYDSYGHTPLINGGSLEQMHGKIVLDRENRRNKLQRCACYYSLPPEPEWMDPCDGVLCGGVL